jgi:hypothetical protein
LHPFLCSYDPTFGWGELAQGGVTVRIVSGAHESILDEPFAKEAAARLRDCLQDGDKESSPSSHGPFRKTARVIASSILWILEFAPAL